ncbi:MAG: HIT family protein [Candidatus Limnocylindrales bacterium]|jgi:diadenosine tetraphosphate (Ap4A) HIT family hydrolase
MHDCIFCEIAAGRAPASIVYRDDRVTAFLDHNPVTPGHLMVIPNTHVAFLAEVDEDLGAHVFTVATRLAAALRSSDLPCEGINLFLADGEAAFQEVLHVHLHVIPRTAGDGFTVDATAWSGPKPTLEALEANAVAIRGALAHGH